MPAAKVDDYEACSKLQLSRIFDLNRATVDKAIYESRIKPSGEVGGQPVYAVREAAIILVPIYRDRYPKLAEVDDDDDDEEDDDPWRLDPVRRKAWFDSEEKRIQVETLRKTRMPIGQVRHHIAMVFKQLALMLEKLPGELEQRFQMPAAQADLLERELDNIRSGMAAEIRRLFSGEESDPREAAAHVRMALAQDQPPDAEASDRSAGPK